MKMRSKHRISIAITHDLSLLRDVELVRFRPEGNWHWYAFEAEGLARLAKSLHSPQEVTRWASEAAEELPDRLIRNYFDPEGRLRQIPAARKKRYTVLAWLAHTLIATVVIVKRK